jgi:hypothetical protein
MAYSAKILADSRGPSGHRVTSVEVTLPRIVLAELNTHRVFSRNSASSRAIPIEKMVLRTQEDPFIPERFPKNGPGMQPAGYMEGLEHELAQEFWLVGRDSAIEAVEKMKKHGVHKQITNRLLEPFLWHTVIITATEWDNWDGLRRDKNAQAEIRRPANDIFALRESSQPEDLDYGQWHLPLVPDKDLLRMEKYTDEEIARLSCARCGRVSYLTHDGKRDIAKDFEMADNLQKPGHMSPFEHAARPMFESELKMFTRPGIRVINHAKVGKMLVEDADHPTYFCGNVQGFIQYRKLIPGEAVFTQMQL